MKYFLLPVFIFVSLSCISQQKTNSNGWISLIDGKTLNGWKVGDNASTFSIRDGAIVANGPVAHLYNVGDVKNHDFKNFEFKAEVMTTPVSNSGIYFHTAGRGGGGPGGGGGVRV